MIIRRLGLLAGAALALSGAGYLYVTSGGLIARQAPSRLEAWLARHALSLSIPQSARLAKSPLEGTTVDLESGRGLYLQKCQSCHGTDGAGRIEAGLGLYPPALDLRSREIQNLTDGALLYFIKNGIRNTGMPGWALPDRELWQLVAYVRALPKTVQAEASITPDLEKAHHSGSVSCKQCHREIYETWSKTRMANVVLDPKEHPDAIIPDFNQPHPLASFTPADIALVYGSRWKQRYFKKVGDDFFPLPAQWDIIHKKWKPYFVKEDWWVKYYPADNSQRPTGPTCDGCHSVGYDVTTRKVAEWNVGCEKCHGPGSEHVAHPTASNIVNPSRLDFVRANDTCIQCHSQGRPLQNPIGGRYYDWPVGFTMGRSLADFWKLEDHRAGETSFYFFGEGTAHKNRMQGNDFAKSIMYTHGVSCFTCHDPHRSDHEAGLRKPANQLCLDCHAPKSPNGPFAATLEAHTHHKAGCTGSDCIACHMPKLQQTLPDVFVRSHTFHFVSPAVAAKENMPNACNLCHSDKSVDWAAQAVKGWANVSPWRAQ